MWGPYGWLPAPFYLVFRVLCTLIILPRLRNKKRYGRLLSYHFYRSPAVTGILQWLLFEEAAHQLHLVNFLEGTGLDLTKTFAVAWICTVVVLLIPKIGKRKFFLQPVIALDKKAMLFGAAVYVVAMFFVEIGVFLMAKLFRVAIVF